MSEDEKKIDTFLKGIMSASELEAPSEGYTKSVMQKVHVAHLGLNKKYVFVNQLLLGLLGVAICSLFVIGSIYAWDMGWVSYFYEQATSISSFISSWLPFNMPVWVLIAMCLHLVLIRIAVAAFLFKSKRTNAQGFALE